MRCASLVAQRAWHGRGGMPLQSYLCLALHLASSPNMGIGLRHIAPLQWQGPESSSAPGTPGSHPQQSFHVCERYALIPPSWLLLQAVVRSKGQGGPPNWTSEPPTLLWGTPSGTIFCVRQYHIAHPEETHPHGPIFAQAELVNDDWRRWRIKLPPAAFDDDLAGGRDLRADLQRLASQTGAGYILMEAKVQSISRRLPTYAHGLL